MNTTTFLKNENGALMIVITVMLLVLLTIISFAASRTTNTELKIAGNEYLYQRCFYYAEGAIMETVDFLDTTVDLTEDYPKWVGFDESAINDRTVFTYWAENAETKDAAPKGSLIDSENTGYLAVHHGVIAGNSLTMSKPTIHSFSIYSRCQNRGLVVLKVGYRKVYR